MKFLMVVMMLAVCSVCHADVWKETMDSVDRMLEENRQREREKDMLAAMQEEQSQRRREEIQRTLTEAQTERRTYGEAN